MRSTWLNLRKAVTEINNFKQLLYTDSDSDGNTDYPNEYTQDSFEHTSAASGRVSPAAVTSPRNKRDSHCSLEAADQRLRMIQSLGEVPHEDSGDVLGDFTSKLISQYETGLREGGGTFGNSLSVSSSISYNSNIPSNRDIDIMGKPLLITSVKDLVDTGSSVAISSRLHLLYKFCERLESLWKEIEDRVRDCTGYTMFVPPMERPSSWQKCQSVHNEHTEKILTWLERSLHTMGVLSRVLKIEETRVLDGPSVLLDSIKETEPLSSNSIGSSIDGCPEERPGEYMRLISYISKIQADYDRRIEKLQATQNSALVKASKSSELEEQVKALQDRIASLEDQLVEKRKEIKYLTDSLLTANTVKTQLVQKNEELIASNQRLLMRKSEFIDKDTVVKMIEQYYAQDRTGGQRREDIIKLLESMLGIEPPAPSSKPGTTKDVRTLANEFIDFLEEG
ncbi:golgin subfamily A member 4 isoform X6, putative [Babesia ovis]|uniref:Golgin subfamily A member 4 isoform X6, putative n=1 Tax=Babesia ovis TaxID=5869 RepID=A0A9W5T7E7_BABOV|nr:golgin subfamily A member 4 isoform X6, putative [Babesia ovis]